ncbi:hemolysin family protein [Tessaracoccus lubricantis]|uniref:Hemolysin family protein n=1 Tax=Tessaracoccus lubricantis TaxID=545543 RepID=A0ABP9FCZ3_9ACTN
MTPLETGMNGWAVVIWTVVIIVLSAFFVAVEFALMAAKPHRLEERAGTLSGRAALKSSHELTLVLAGSQLGITVCTLALGAITKPAVHHALTPLLETTGLPAAVADVASFVLALVIVTFLHLVVGEMAPKSWAIAHPEDSSVLLALPMRGFMLVARPILKAMNAMANWLVRKAGATPIDGLSATQDVAGLRHLVEHSANVGALEASYQSPITSVLTLRERKLSELVPAGQELAAVPIHGTLADVQAVTRRHGHMRVLVRDGEVTVGIVHVRDTLGEADLTRPAIDLAREPVRLPGDSGVATALSQLNQARTQIAVVTDGERELGIVTLNDVLPGLMPTGIVESVDAG